MTPDLKAFDVILVNSSAGKDSQAMLDLIVAMARVLGVLDRVVVVHCDLGRVEWKGTRELAEEQAKHYGLRFEVVTRAQGDLLTHIESRRMFPSKPARYCTSDHKRSQVRRLMTKLVSELRESLGLSGKSARQIRILNCMGLRAAESPSRSKLVAFELDDGASNGKRDVWTWLPLHAWTTEQVWTRIRASGVRHHPAYDLGMPRLSCCFCIFSSRPALILAGQHNPELLAEYVRVEKAIGHTFKRDLSLESIQAAIAAGEQPGPITTWEGA